ncbi:MAG: nucleoside-diphosphate kinase [Candidatus Helarchaeota archaeon]
MKSTNNERVLVFLKPDCTIRRPVSAKILESFINNNFKIIAFKEIMVNQELAEKHYEEHKGKFFYPWLCKMIQLFPVIALIIEDKPERIREFIGNTFCHKADKNTIRGKYGIWGGVNSVHASDSLTSGERELRLWAETVDLVPNEENIQDEINQYIKKWNKKIKTDIENVRKICDNIKNNPNKIDFYKNELKKILFPDCEDCITINKEIFDEFLQIIVDNCLL